MNIMGFEFDAMGSLWIIMGLVSMLGVGGIFLFFYMDKIHPKKAFKVYGRSGIFSRNYRLYYAKFPTEEDIMSLLMGKKPVGFPINWFKQEFFDGKRCYVGQSFEGRLFPLPLRDMVGIATFTLKKCSSCGVSDKYSMTDDMANCPQCKNRLVYETVAIDGIMLQAMKYNPEIETRAIYTTELEKDKLLPLAEYLQIYDVGAKIAEAMDKSDEQTRHILEQNNPFISAMIASLPLAVIMIGFGLAAYIMWQGMGQQFIQGGASMAAFSENAKTTAEITYNTTKILAEHGLLKG